MTGVNGGLVIVAADDPSMHSSQNEQDSRFYGKFAMIPVLEPSSQQEAYDLTRYAFEVSEKYHLPVLVRITTRLAHSRSVVERSAVRKENEMALPADLRQFVLLPAIARKKYRSLLSAWHSLHEESRSSGVNRMEKGAGKKRGIISCGLAYNYYREVAEEHHLEDPVLKISQYPVPPEILREFVQGTGEVILMEEGSPLLEESLRGILETGHVIRGRLDGTLPRDGELNPALVAKALGLGPDTPDIPGVVQNRPPALCRGCGHIDMYNALNEAIEPFGPGRVFSDIGCYTLGALPPYNAINSCVDMGASVTMAKGAADAGMHPSVAVIGDSTFTHSGMTGLLDAVMERTPVTIIISDNAATAMTGGQISHATGRLAEICRGLGVEEEHLRVIIPLKKNHDENVTVIREELAFRGVSVIIFRRECVQMVRKRGNS
jgi:indolepyruvate ferredoxin oxidoreductase alpha subunit